MAVTKATISRPPSGGPPISPLAVPPAWLPLSWLACAVIGLIGSGVTLVFNASTLVRSHTAPASLGTVHVAMLAFLSTAVLGASHQFGPVVAGRRLRSVTAGLVTLVLWVPAAWLLPYSFASRRFGLLEFAAVMAVTAVCIAVWNLSAPLHRWHRGTPVIGLGLAVLFLLVTAAFGATYAFDMHHGYFLLLPRRILAHAHLGLIGWIGLGYVAVAEKLWPMFLLAHRPTTTAGDWAVRLVAGGVPVVAIGLLLPSVPLTSIGAGVVTAGLTCHLVSLIGVIQHRRRRMELLHAFILTSAVMLIVAVWCAVIAGMFPVSDEVRTRAVKTEVFALTMWLGLAVIGHLHKIVPFISWSRMRKAGHTKAPNGRPLLFAHLVNPIAARTCYGLGTFGAVIGIAGMATEHPLLLRVSGIALAVTGLTVLVNLASGPLRIIAIDRRRARNAAAEPVAAPTGSDKTPVGVS